MPDLAICPCQHCNGHIQFDPATVSEENNKIACPHCSLETILFVPPATETKMETILSQPPPPPPNEDTITFTCSHCAQPLEATEDSRGAEVQCPKCGKTVQVPTLLFGTYVLELRLHSGMELRVKAIRLYDEFALAQFSAKKAEAIKLLRGVSTGIGAIGDIEWVLAASLVIGAVDGALSSGAQSAGGRLLTEAIEMERAIRKTGAFHPVGTIQDIESPVPGSWRVPTKKTILVEVEGFLGPRTETKIVPSAFIHNGDDFIFVQTDDDSVCAICWSAVERYQKVESHVNRQHEN